MKVYESIEQASLSLGLTIVTIGAFDGVHRGHRALIKKMNDIAENKNMESVVITFNPHPNEIFGHKIKVLSTIKEKLELLKEAEVQNVIIINFTPEFSQIPYDVFVKEHLIKLLNTQAIISSSNHYFGNKKEGSIDVLKNYGIETYYLDRVEDISSSKIREAIEQNDMELVHELLGSPYLIMQSITESPNKLLPLNINEYIVSRSPHIRTKI